MASGQRINRAADDPAGLAISEKLRAEISGVKQAINNTEVSVTVVQTAEGALGEVSNLLLGLRQLAIAAANSATNDYDALTALQTEIRTALQSIDRVTQHTRFGNKSLLDGSQGAAGVGNRENIVFLGASAKTRASPVEGYTMEVTRLPEKAFFSSDLDDEIAEGLRISLEEEDGNLIEIKTPEGGTAINFMSRLEKAIKDAHLNLDVNYDEDKSELKISHKEYGLAKGFSVTSFKEDALTGDVGVPNLFLGLDIKGKIGGENAEGDGLELKGNPDNYMTSDLRVAYMGDQLGDVGKVIVAQNAMQFQIGTQPGDKVGVAIDSTHSSRLALGIDNQSGFNSLAEINVFTPQAAEDSIRLVDEANDQLLSLRGKLGAVQKYALETNMATLRITQENLIAAESVIRNSDLAQEVAQYTKYLILTEAAAAASAQTNRMDPDILRFLINNR
jgi:flagellin